MLVLAHHKKRHVMAITSRSVLAVVIAITALANIITVMKEFPWDSMVVTDPLIDLGGPAWEQDGLIITGVLLLLIARALIRGKRQAWWLSVGLLTFSLTSAFVSKSDSSTILLALGLWYGTKNKERTRLRISLKQQDRQLKLMGSVDPGST